MASKQIRETALAEQALDSALHRGSTHFRGCLRAIADDVRRSRREDYPSLTRQYYNLTTDIYEYSWGQSFHFCRFSRGGSFSQAMIWHQHVLAASIGIKGDMKVLDVGCGVGGPAQEMVKFTGCYVTGLNLNKCQVNRADNYSKSAGLSHKFKFAMPFPDSFFNAVYAIEAAVHPPSLQGVHSEIRRVLKPGGVVGIYEWLMTDEYDNENLAHRSIRVDIEQAFGISNMVQVSNALEAVEAAGLGLEVHTDLAVDKDGPNAAPWYWPMSRDLKYMPTGWDLISALKHRVSVALALSLLWLLAAVHIAPPGAMKTLDIMAKGGDALATGGSQGIFTPMYLLIARKPEV
ncbi:putative sterol 24-c-methyltransferase [Xylaria acuta]|nr:putative sterol 24-c-methyltransferase [Xylaria acuta]